MNTLKDKKEEGEETIRHMHSHGEKLDIFGTKDRSESRSPVREIIKKDKDNRRGSKFIKDDISQMVLHSKDNYETPSRASLDFHQDSHKLYPCKQNIIATVDKINSKNIEEYEEYYTKLVQSGVNILKMSISIFDEDNFEKLKRSYLKLKEIMKLNRNEIPILISMEYRIMRLTNNNFVSLKKEEIILIKFSNKNNVEAGSQIDHIIKSNSSIKVYFINNVEYLNTYKVSLGDKIICDFGRAVLSITKIYFKNGKVLEKSQEELKKELNNNLKNHFQSEKFQNILNKENEDNINKSTEDLEKELLNFIDDYYHKSEHFIRNEPDKEEMIDFIEAVVNFDCILNPRRPVQIIKQSKQIKLNSIDKCERFDYIPKCFYIYCEKVIQQLNFDYILLDYFSEDIYEFTKNTISKFEKNVSIVTKISDLYSLKNIKYVYKHSDAVVLALNYFCKELSFIEVSRIIHIDCDDH